MFLGDNDRVVKSPSPNLKLSLPKELLTESSVDVGRDLSSDRQRWRTFKGCRSKDAPLRNILTLVVFVLFCNCLRITIYSTAKGKHGHLQEISLVQMLSVQPFLMGWADRRADALRKNCDPDWGENPLQRTHL